MSAGSAIPAVESAAGITAFGLCLLKSRKMLFSVIPAEAGIKHLQAVTNSLGCGFRRSDDILQSHQN